MDRITVITTHFAAHGLEIGVTTTPLDAEAWSELELSVATTQPFGYLPPTLDDETDEWEMRYCPTIIEAQTAELDDEDLHNYLEACDAQASLFVIHDDGQDRDDLRRKVEDALFDVAPGSLMLLTRVQMAVLDSQAV